MKMKSILHWLCLLVLVFFTLGFPGLARADGVPTTAGEYSNSFRSLARLSTSYHQTCGIRMNGKIVCWGINDGHTLDAPDGEFIQIDAGYNYTCAIRVNGAMAYWGSNLLGQSQVPGYVYLPLIRK
jgi:hypothetical protein